MVCACELLFESDGRDWPAAVFVAGLFWFAVEFSFRAELLPDGVDAADGWFEPDEGCVDGAPAFGVSF